MLQNHFIEAAHVSVCQPVSGSPAVVARNQFKIFNGHLRDFARCHAANSSPPISDPRELSERKLSTDSCSRPVDHGKTECAPRQVFAVRANYKKAR